MCDFRCLTSMLIITALGTGSGLAQAQQPNASRVDQILPGRLGLPATNTRSSEPFVIRIYKTDDNDQPLKKQPKGYPFTITEDYELGENEKPIVHKGVDITSRPGANQAAVPMDFKAGVYGLVVRAGGGDWGTISVQIRDGSVIQYLHTTASHVKVGDLVTPDTLLGVTGRTGARDIHLHIQAKTKFNDFISPDVAFKVGQKKLSTPIKPEDGADADFDPDQFVGVQPKVKGRKVEPKVELPTKWVVEVIGGGGKIDEVLGNFPTYRDAAYCSQRWSEDHPDDLRLTREREVATSNQENL
jgi:murein DD-endopeptidase MepM/ murein hydrolase activator NlpD